MSQVVIQGDWDDLVKRPDLHGRRVRIIVLDDEQDGNPWLTSLRAWAEAHAPVQHQVNDDREDIYGGTVDDPR